MKMRHVCYYNNSDATFRLLMSGDINSNPGPVSISTAGKNNCLVMNARSLKSITKTAQQTGNPCVTSIASGLVHAENSDVICVNETWLNQNISNSEILHSGFTIFRRDRSDRGGAVVVEFLSQSKQPPSKLSKNLNLNRGEGRKPSCNSLRSFWPKLPRLLVKEFYFDFTMGHPIKTQVGWMYSVIVCMKFVTSSTIW